MTPTKVLLVKNEKAIPLLRKHLNLDDSWLVVGNKSNLAGQRFDVVVASVSTEPLDGAEVRDNAIPLCRPDSVYLEI